VRSALAQPPQSNDRRLIRFMPRSHPSEGRALAGGRPVDAAPGAPGDEVRRRLLRVAQGSSPSTATPR
jgi:hypothetical protein